MPSVDVANAVEKLCLSIHGDCAMQDKTYPLGGTGPLNPRRQILASEIHMMRLT